MGLIIKITIVAIIGTALFGILRPMVKGLTNYLNENKDIMDMPPWEHENKWNSIRNKKETCYFHKISQKKICRQN